MINQFLTSSTSQSSYDVQFKIPNLAALDAYEIGQRIRQARIAKGLKQKELIEDQFSKSYISSIEAGRLIPSPRAFEFFSERLGVSIPFLQWGSETPPQEPPIDLTASRARLEPQFSPGLRKRLNWELTLTLAQIELEQGRPEVARAQLQEHGVPSAETSPSLAAQYHYLSARIYLFQADTKMALQEIARAHEIAQTLPEKELAVRLQDLMADCYHSQGRYTEAVTYRKLAFETIKQEGIEDPAFEAKVYYSLAEELSLLNETEAVLGLYRQAVEQASRLNQREQLAEVYYEVSLGYQKQLNPTFARYYAERSLMLYEEVKNLRLAANIVGGYGEALIERRQYAEAETQLQQGLDLAVNLGNWEGAAVNATNLSLVYAYLPNVAQEEKYALLAVDYAQKSEDAVALGQAMARLANMYAARGSLADADRCFSQAVSLLEPKNMNSTLGTIYFEYGRTLMNLARDREAAILFEKAYVLQSNHHG